MEIICPAINKFLAVFRQNTVDNLNAVDLLEQSSHTAWRLKRQRFEFSLGGLNV